MARKSKNNRDTDTLVTLREDHYVYNEATGFLITSGSLAGKGWDPDQSDWAEAVERGDLIATELYQDDPFIIRVVLNDSLAETEESEWVGRFSHKLNVLDGKLVICGGIEYVMEPREEGEASWTDEYARVLDVPSGEYEAVLYTYINSVNSDRLIEMAQTQEETVAEYFRRTRHNEEFPQWLKSELVAYPARDPGHEQEWRGQGYVSPGPYVHFLLHLTPLRKGRKLSSPAPELGFFFAAHTEARKPSKCPLGILGENIKELPSDEPRVLDLPVEPLEIYEDASRFKLERLDQYISLELRKLHLPFILAWYGSSSAQPELRIEGPEAERISAELHVPERSRVKLLDASMCHVQMEASGARWGMFSYMDNLAENLSDFSLSDGTVLELCVYLSIETKPHYLRFRGPVREGKWCIEAIYPLVQSSILKEAIQLAEQAESGRGLSGLDKALAAEILILFEEEWKPLLKDNKISLDGADLVFSKPDNAMMHLYASMYFKEKFCNSWEVSPIDEELKQKAKRRKLQQEFASKVLLEGALGRKYYLTSSEILGKEAVDEWSRLHEELCSIGARLIGEISCSQFGDFVFRYYSMPDCQARFVCYRGGLAQTLAEFISDFDDGSSLSTSGQPGPGDDKKLKIYRTRNPRSGIAELYELHRKRAEELSAELGSYRVFDGTLLECASRFEEAIIKQS